MRLNATRRTFDSVLVLCILVVAQWGPRTILSTSTNTGTLLGWKRRLPHHLCLKKLYIYIYVCVSHLALTHLVDLSGCDSLKLPINSN